MPHIHEQYDFTVSFYIVHDGKVLLTDHPKYDLWIAPGGHVELDENPDQALMREIDEETGLEVEIINEKPDWKQEGAVPLYTPFYMDDHAANLPHRHMALVYFARAKNNKHVLSDEHREIRWFSAGELSDPQYSIPANTQFYAREAIKRVGESAL